MFWDIQRPFLKGLCHERAASIAAVTILRIVICLDRTRLTELFFETSDSRRPNSLPTFGDLVCKITELYFILTVAYLKNGKTYISDVYACHRD